MDFKIGQAVVCINATDTGGVLKVGEIYHVRQMNVCKCGVHNITLKEFSKPGEYICDHCDYDLGDYYNFFVARFAPVKYDGIAIPQELRHFVPVRERIDVALPQMI